MEEHGTEGEWNGGRNGEGRKEWEEAQKECHSRMAGLRVFANSEVRTAWSEIIETSCWRAASERESQKELPGAKSEAGEGTRPKEGLACGEGGESSGTIRVPKMEDAGTSARSIGKAKCMLVH
ncbi:hypothetical protein CONPUDRAFT_73883 [Coniophora puteana RWD-64-598 SS2]|uniref:Uncharacterized protein n=1 Tax=Coniophora puteana (strain RWD-64-598) TaxID=741705 RepID=A0A5M3MP54_CONPW|nr:uncharacterized protein CONPUDRAFT_73883 [Coniophora puteana RWD-64-598 SS2]EIW80873.1 hypothetical protein CONPUDRAFT_73883 [Coniophora puteana RWD-64-598 SS2]